ncbi:Gfo/Idh/MocA family oxidoreductase [uncultured Proteiniphilum sp.]|uniref:Gfo/Idh/MocA family protein n=1 Tax=uncultured Proteiniphilum sp. TaxID=497637 RepID=UPI002615ED9A|nr:Gfo/Idh/MocA family oxidoreductase [uncultured Proteiniphilum sp.]
MDTPVRVGIIGLGARGSRLMSELLKINEMEIAALCDLFQDRINRAVTMCKERRNQTPKTYCKDDTTYLEMLDKEQLDAVIIASYWEYHTPMAVEAMKRGIYPGIEVPCSLTVEECWALVETSEKTGVPCMMLENWSFRRDNLAILNMIRKGFFGEIIHSHCAHSHDCIDHWFFDSQTGTDRWPAKYLVNYNRDQYPTHSVGPVLSWMDINCGDVFTEIYSTATASKGINAYFKRKFGENHPNANRKFKQGDIVTSTLKTANGKTLIINYDMQLPRPYSNRWLIQGTLGVYDEERGGIYLAEKSPNYHQWEEWKPYEEKYLHKWWQPDGIEAGGHGGVDYIQLREFIKAVRAKGPVPLNVYDSAVMSAIVDLSGQSIKKNRPVAFPDFTKGKWKTRKPYFGI